jgi:hypothetical protein
MAAVLSKRHDISADFDNARESQLTAATSSLPVLNLNECAGTYDGESHATVAARGDPGALVCRVRF